MYAFNYHRPSSTEEAVKLAGADADAVFLAGGQTMIPTLKLRLANPSAVIDVAGIKGLDDIKLTADSVKIGAAVTHAEVAASAEIAKAIPALSELASLIGDAQVRNRGTIGGSIANADPAADYPAAVVGLGATIVTDRRQIAGDDFFTGLFETALEPGELIVSVSFPIPLGAAYQKFANPASGYAIVGVMVAKTSGGVRVGVTGAGPAAYRATAIEAALSGTFSADSAKSVGVSADGLNSDLHATAEYRASLVGTLAARAAASLG